MLQLALYSFKYLKYWTIFHLNVLCIIMYKSPIVSSCNLLLFVCIPGEMTRLTPSEQSLAIFKKHTSSIYTWSSNTSTLYSISIFNLFIYILLLVFFL